jgi:SHS2 domain-containing protein
VKYWEEVEHTADWALQVWGNDLRSLFEHAARGMAWLIGGHPRPGEASERHTVVLDAPDRETLLVDWLNELVYLVEEHSLVITQVEITDFSDRSLVAIVEGSPGEDFVKHIKAVTYHDLAIRCTASRCGVTIVFDV